MIYFDHCYTQDKNHRFLKKLGKLGFALNDREAKHPGGTRCRFLMFDNPKLKRRVQYLEFISAEGKRQINKPGISFGYDKALEKLYNKIKKERRYKAKFVHRNYDWANDSKSRLPGWNFLSFTGLGMPQLYPWMTEYETRPDTPTARRPKIKKHKNGAQRIHAFEMEVSPKAQKFFAYLFNQKFKPVMTLKCGTILHLIPSHRTRFNKVIIQTRKFKKPTAEWQGRPAIKIANPAAMWDLYLI